MLIDKKLRNPDELARLFTELTDDLSYARTHYPESETVNYLNELTALIHQQIYKNKREKGNKVANFWKTKLPLLLHKHHKAMFTSFIIFFIAICIGVLSQHFDKDFASLVLSPGYVQHTIDNIENGEPLAIYNTDSEFMDFLGFAIHNTKVAYLTFALGVILGLGTAFLLFYNGIILGSFFYFFYQYGVFDDAMFGVWLHGTLEIWAIVIGGMAGLAMGNGFLFPKTYSRGVSFAQGAKDGLRIVIGVTPLFIVAGFMEAYITQHTENMAMWQHLIIILSFLSFVIWYFIIFPHVQYRRQEDMDESPVYRIAGITMMSVGIGLALIVAFLMGLSGVATTVFSVYFFAIGGFFTLLGYRDEIRESSG